MKQYKHIFFDLDDTLWDLKSNSFESLKTIYEKHKFGNYFSSFDFFCDTFHNKNIALWDDYRKGLISRDTLTSQRFLFVAETLNAPLEYAIILNSEYLADISKRTKIIENAFQTLNYLKKKYLLHIITDGFFEVQVIKLNNSRLSSFFQHIITAEEIGYLKPNAQLFNYALKITESKKEEAIMIGDSYENDIIGAYNCGIDQIYFNAHNRKNLDIEPTHKVNKLIEILDIL